MSETISAWQLIASGDATLFAIVRLSLAVSLTASPDLVTHTLETSDHVLTQDVEHETVFALVWEFLAARLH